jgi:hypothetical protein
MRRSLFVRLLLPLLLLGAAAPAFVLAAQQAPSLATRRAHVDAEGVIRWNDDNREVLLFGANYAIASSSDYRAAGYLTSDRKRVIDDDVAHFARMGWNGMRLAFWGDWQNSDLAGNLLANDHLDLLDYLIARARERGIYILFNPIHTYHAGWPDAMGDSFPGFAAHIPKDRLGTDSAAIAAQVRYLGQILNHVNPYTGVALKDEPAILFIEMINEPVHHPEDLAGSVRYIDALAGAVRATGSKAILFHNMSQDFRIAEAIRRSTVPGASFGWYPAGLNAGHQLAGNYLRSVDDYPGFAMAELRGRPRLVYEFDSADQLTGYMYPAMMRTFRQGGAQLAAMFAYDMLVTASRNLGWQTHRLNLAYTPRKAMSAVIAAEAMRRLPRGGDYGSYPGNTRFGPFRVSYERDASEMATADALLYAGSTTTAPPDPARLERVAGYGSSPVAEYDGEGVYFLDRVREGVWRLEVYPDAVDVQDPFEMQRADKVVTRAIWREHQLRLALPGLGDAFTVEPVNAPNAAPTRAVGGRFPVTPGVYVLSAAGPVSHASLPSHIGALGFSEFHAPPPDPLPTSVVHRPEPQHGLGGPLRFDARVVSDAIPDSVVLWLRPAGSGWFRPYPMQRTAAYDYHASVAPDGLREGPYEYVISVRERNLVITFPEGVRRAPSAWDFSTHRVWSTVLAGPRLPLTLLRPAEDARLLAFSRIGDGYREGIFRIVSSSASGEPALHFELPVNVGGISPEDYTTSLVVLDRIAGRSAQLGGARSVRVRLRGIGPSQRLWLTLMERDGTSWSTSVEAGPEWVERSVPLAAFRPARGVKLPQGFPGTWNYWVGPAEDRGGEGDAMRLAEVERLQLSLRREAGVQVQPGSYGVEVESVTLLFQ